MHRHVLIYSRFFHAAVLIVAFAGIVSCGGGGGATNPGSVPTNTVNPVMSEWPNASNTGIPAGTTLTVYTGSNQTVSDGQVFDGFEFPNRIYVNHSGVIFRNCRLTGDQYYAIYATVPGKTTPQGGVNLTVENCDITSGVLLVDGFTGRRNHIHAAIGKTMDDGWSLSASNILLEDNLIDGLVGEPGAHLDGIQAMGGDNIVIRHNWIEAVSPPITGGGGVNAAIFFSPAAAFGNRANTNIVVENNMLIEEAGYYPLRIEAQGTVVVRHNRWRRGHLGTPCHLVNTILTTWEDNAYEDGAVIAAPSE